MKDLIVYIIHYTPLKERKIFLLDQINKHSLNYHFIEDYDREKLLDKDLKIFDKNLSRSLCGLTLAHIDSYRKIINNDYKYNLIIEDDVIFDSQFKDKLKKGLKQLPDSYDMLFIGDGCDLHIPKNQLRPSKFVYKKCNEKTKWGGGGATRCTDSYLVSKKCAKKLINYVSQLKEHSVISPIDWWLNKIIKDLNLQIYWMEPTIVTQGSGSGSIKKYNSSLRS